MKFLFMFILSIFIFVGCGESDSKDESRCPSGKVEVDVNFEDAVCVSEGTAKGFATNNYSYVNSSKGNADIGSLCFIRWTCDIDTLKLDCKPVQSGYLCQCLENAVGNFSFFSKSVCSGDITTEYMMKIAADNCNWPISEEKKDNEK